MRTRFDIRFRLGVAAGILLMIWSGFTLLSLVQSGAANSVAYFNRQAPVTHGQIWCAMFLLGGAVVAVSFAFRMRQ